MIIVNVLVNNDERTIVTEARHSGLPPVVIRRHSFIGLTFSCQQHQQHQQSPAGLCDSLYLSRISRQDRTLLMSALMVVGMSSLTSHVGYALSQ